MLRRTKDLQAAVLVDLAQQAMKDASAGKAKRDVATSRHRVGVGSEDSRMRSSAKGHAKTGQPVRDNSLSIVLFVLFAISIAAQSFAGWRLLNEALAAHGQAPIGFWHFLSSGTFWEGLSSNWQAAVLQLGSLIAFSTFLYQRGAPHSLDPDKAKRRQKPRKAGRFAWVYRHSLLLTFLLLFVLTLALHIVSGTGEYNEQLALTGQPSVSIAAFLLSAQFWSTTLQTWQAEYLVLALYVVLTIFLRQEGSPESKPVEAKNATTGEANK